MKQLNKVILHEK